MRYRIDYWELAPLGWRGSSELDTERDTLEEAMSYARSLLQTAAVDNMVAYVAVRDTTTGSLVWEARTTTLQASLQGRSS